VFGDVQISAWQPNPRRLPCPFSANTSQNGCHIATKYKTIKRSISKNARNENC
jgi:hypothetical protein